MLRLTVEPLDLGPDVRAVGLELVDSESGEPVGGGEAAQISSTLIRPRAVSIWASMPILPTS